MLKGTGSWLQELWPLDSSLTRSVLRLPGLPTWARKLYWNLLRTSEKLLRGLQQEVRVYTFSHFVKNVVSRVLTKNNEKLGKVALRKVANLRLLDIYLEYPVPV